MNRLTRKIEGGQDAFGAPLVGTYEIVDDTPGLAMAKVRCQLGRYEDTGLTPESVQQIKNSLDDIEALGDLSNRVGDILREIDEPSSKLVRAKKGLRVIIDIMEGL